MARTVKSGDEKKKVQGAKADPKNISAAINALKDLYKHKSMLGSFSDKDPFYILIATALSARNRDDQTIIAVKRLFSAYRTPEDIASAPVKKLESLIKESGFYKTKAQRIKDISKELLERFDGKVPADMESLVSLPGVGRKTAGCVLVYAFNTPAIPVDTHVHRISNRLGLVKTRHPEETEQELMKIVPKGLWPDVNEVFVLHGQNICRPIGPKCSVCPVSRYCKKRIWLARESLM